jgi:dihydroneopterin aldolase
VGDYPLETFLASVGFCKHRIDCIIGVYPEERKKEQSLFVDLTVKVNLAKFLSSGAIEDTIDYDRLAHMCTSLAKEKQYLLLESFASDILAQCKEQFKVSWAHVRIEKPSAIPSAGCAFVEMEYR